MKTKTNVRAVKASQSVRIFCIVIGLFLGLIVVVAIVGSLVGSSPTDDPNYVWSSDPKLNAEFKRLHASTTREDRTRWERQEEEEARQKAPGVTKANYNRLKMGMTYAQVVNFLGKEGTELGSMESFGTVTVHYQWDGDGGLSAWFQNGKLVEKVQAGLR